MSVYNAGGINVNYVVSHVLDPLHKIEQIQVMKYLSSDIAPDGSVIPTYADPITIEAQIQQPNAEEHLHVRRVNDNTVARRFWVNMWLKPLDRAAGTAGDLILYDGYKWEVDSQPDDFNKQGWCSVIALRVI